MDAHYLPPEIDESTILLMLASTPPLKLGVYHLLLGSILEVASEPIVVAAWCISIKSSTS
jgi:hypothetical protein